MGTTWQAVDAHANVCVCPRNRSSRRKNAHARAPYAGTTAIENSRRPFRSKCPSLCRQAVSKSDTNSFRGDQKAWRLRRDSLAAMTSPPQTILFYNCTNFLRAASPLPPPPSPRGAQKRSLDTERAYTYAQVCLYLSWESGT